MFDDASFGGLDGVGIHLAPSDFHDKVLRIVSGQEKGIILDVRNEYEYDIGHFEGATNLKTYYYSETWRAMESALKGTQDEDTEVLMYCTGGIRCELASKFAKSASAAAKSSSFRVGFTGIWRPLGPREAVCSGERISSSMRRFRIAAVAVAATRRMMLWGGA